ncbi:unnamed protein product, partial [Closterium sp. NIES-53]
RDGEFSSDLLRAFCRAEGIRQTFTLPASPQQNGIAERRIGMVMDIALRCASDQPSASCLLAGDYTYSEVDGEVDKLSSRAVPCVFLGFPPDAPGWQFYHPTSRRVLSSQDVTFDESMSYYHPAESIEVAVDSGAARGAEPVGRGTGGAEPGGVEPEGAEPGGAEPEHVEPGGAEPECVEPGGADPERVEPGGAEFGGAEPACAASGGSPGVPLRREPLSLQRLREWYARRCRRAAGAAGGAACAGAAGGAACAGAAGGTIGAGAARGAAGARATVGARTGGTGAAGSGGAASVGAAGTGAGGAAGVVPGDPGAEGTGAVSAVSGGATRPRPYYVPLLQQSQLQPSSPLPGPSPYYGPTRGLTERREPKSRPAVSLCPLLLRSLPDGPDPESESLSAASPTVTCFLATALTDPLFDSSAASALVAELVDFEEFEWFASTVPHLVSMLLALEGDPDAPDIPTPRSYAEAIEGPYSSHWHAAMDAEMASWKSTGTYVGEVPPPGVNTVSGMWIFRVKRPPGSPPAFKARYVARGFSQRQGVDFFQTFSPTPKMTTLRVLLHVAAQRDYELHLLDFSTAFLQGSLHEEIWLRRPPGFTGSFPAGTYLPPFYVLVYVDSLVFATAYTEGLAHVKSELQKRHTCTDLGELTSYLGLRITRDRAQHTITLTQSHMVQQVLQRFGFTYSSPQSTPLPTGHSLSAPPSDESVEPSGPYPELVGCLMYLMTCT